MSSKHDVDGELPSVGAADQEVEPAAAVISPVPKPTDWEDLRLDARDVEDLKRSCLTPETVQQMGWHTGTDADNRKLLHWSCQVKGDATGLVLTYPGTDYAKVRPHHPRPVAGGEPTTPRRNLGFQDHCLSQRDLDEDPPAKLKVRKYEAPIGEQHRIFNTQAICDNQDPETPLAIIEGEKKGVLLAQEGWAALGIPGVTMAHDPEARLRSWDDGKDEWMPHPELKAYLNEGREIFICGDGPDMDGANPDVIRAMVKIAKGVRAAGCQALIPYVEPDPKCEKLGVDDWVFKETEKMLRAHPTKSPVWARKLLVTSYFGTARPAEPSALLDWLVKHKQESGELASIEIQRAIFWSWAWFGDRRLLAKWSEALKKRHLINSEVVDKLVARLPSPVNRYEPVTWVRRWLERQSVVYSYRDDGFVRGGGSYPRDLLLARLEIDATNDGVGSGKGGGLIPETMAGWFKPVSPSRSA